MRISTINYKNHQPNFSAWQRTVYKQNKLVKSSIEEISHRNDTTFFREDLIWDSLTRLLKDKYEDVSKVNIYNYACSNGSETLSIIMKLLSDLGEKASEKFFPVIAKDFDSLAIKNAQSNSIPISWGEKIRINDFTQGRFDNFFTKDLTSNWYDGDTYFYRPSKILLDKVEFSKADILKDYKNIKSENSVVFARNFWPYILENISSLIHKLSRQMGKNSTLIIGGYDINGCKRLGIDLPMEIVKAGFICADDSRLIFEKF